LLTNVGKVQNALSHTQIAATETTLIERLIKQVGKIAESFCNRYFLYATYTEIFDGDGAKKIYLKGYPVITFSKLEIDDEEIAADDYDVNLDLGEVYYSSGFTEGYQNIKVTYTCGYVALDTILDKDLSTPPSSPSTNDCYIVKAPGAGDWLNHDNEIAKFDGSAWVFTVPYRDMEVYVSDDAKVYKWDGSAWVIVTERDHYPPQDDLEGAVIDEVVARYAMLQTEPITVGSAERIVDLRTGFLMKSSRAFFEALRNYA